MPTNESAPPRGVCGAWRRCFWVPRLMLVVATAHMVVGAVAMSAQWSGIVSDGLWNAIRHDVFARRTALWFMIGGMAFFGLGLLVRRSVIATGRLPGEAGWILPALGMPVVALEPLSGGWALIALGVPAVVASRRDRSAGASTLCSTGRRPVNGRRA
ncbi:DUF6463 family protein [Streptomyces sp. NPDC093097]|uniref:DUF6463 family protein n=1 Tax=Streptomyces sp. NPDC093097 TaxID=3366027 RepID=UPI0038246C73